jgi:hypothetical protein
MGTLSVFYRNFKDGPLKQIWNKSGDQGQIWIRQLLQLNQTEPFQIVIEGKVGRNYLSDIAIDDTIFDPNCLLYNFDLPPMPTTVKPLTTTSFGGSSYKPDTISTSTNMATSSLSAATKSTTTMSSTTTQSFSSSSSLSSAKTIATSTTKTTSNQTPVCVNNCLNGATCTELVIKNVCKCVCSCKTGFTGDLCQTEVLTDDQPGMCILESIITLIRPIESLYIL